MAAKASDATRTKFLLDERDLPSKWYNIQADLKTPAPPVLHPGTGQPIGPQDLAPLFPMELIKQEVSQERWIEIPDEVRDVLKLWRPSPLFRARRLEKALGTPAKIFYKYEGVSPAGSHKPNTAVAQVYENAQAGIKKLTTETGAGQSGRGQAAHTTGSLGIAISEAVEVAAQDPDCNYSLGSVLNHVLLHQTVIGQEARLQMELAGEEPDVVIGCVGGGSNFAGLAFPFMRRRLRDGATTRFLAAEPAAC